MESPRIIGNTVRNESEEQPTSRIARSPKYLKTHWATTSGQDYEVALCCLIFLRALRFTRDFFLASNHAHAGRFDDVVLLYRLQEDQGSKYRAILLQAKHKDDLRSQPFHFSQYFKSFMKIRRQWEPSTEVEGRQVEVQQVTLVLYTNGTRGTCVSTPDVVDASVASHLRDLLHTKGRVQRILDATQVGLHERAESPDFLSRLLVCSGQMNNTTADGYLEDEFRNVLKVAAPEVAHSLNMEFKRLVKEWWSEKEGRYLSADSQEWTKILAIQFARLNTDVTNVARLLDLDFSRAALAEFNHILRATQKSWLSVKDKYQANVTKAKLFKARSNALFIDVMSVADVSEEVETLWGTASCDTIVVDMSTEEQEHPDTLLKRLESAVSRHPGRYLVVIGYGAPKGHDWTVTQAGVPWSSLYGATQTRLLSKRVELQGKDVALRDVVGSPVGGGVISDRVIETLCQATTAVKLGDDLPSALTYYVPRCLERISPNIVTFDSLRNTNTLIGFEELIPIQFTHRISLKILQLRDLKRTGIVQGATFINEALSKYQFRKLCCKYGVRGIWGRLGKESVENHVTEFVPMTWTSEEKIIVVEGDPGIGKSSFVTWMCTHVKERFPEAWVLRVDVGRHSEFIKERDFKDNPRNVKDFLRRGLSPTRNNLEDFLLDHSLHICGNVFLFLDAFDEISPNYTTKCCNLLKEITENVRFRQMVVTTRSVTTKDVEDSLRTKAFTLPGFHDEEQRLFLNKFLHPHEEFVGVKVMSSLSQICGPILEIPVLCKVAAEVILKQQTENSINSESPWSTVLLYQLCFDQILKQGLVEKFCLDACVSGVERLYENYREQQFQNLQELAAKKQLPIQEHKNFWFSDKTPDDKTGFVVSTGNNFEFVHKTFAEYFLGLWLAENWQRCSDELLDGVLFQLDKELVTSTFNWRLFEKCPLHVAVAQGDVDSARECLSSANLDRGGRSPLHVAAMTGGNHRALWALLMSSGQDLKEKDRVLQWRAMDYAEITGHWEIVDFVLEKGHEINYMKFVNDKDAAMETLLVAISKDLPNLFQYLLRLDEEMLQINFGDLNDTLLHIAAAEGSLSIVRALLKVRFPVNVKNLHRITPLLYSSKFGHLNTARELLQNGADIKIRDKNGNVALLEASRGGHFEVVKFLLPYTTDIDTKGYDTNTALLLASSNGHSEIVTLLIANGADFNMKNIYGVTPLMEASRKGYTEVVRILLQQGIGLEIKDKLCCNAYIAYITNVKDNCGRTALQAASMEGHLEVVRMLLENGADVNSKDEFGVTALHKASMKGHSEVVMMLLETGADVDTKDDFGASALQKASTEGHVRTVRILLEIGADVNTKDDFGVTALQLASTEGHFEVVRMLLQNGADVNSKDDFGVTALHKASMRGHSEVVMMLLETGADVDTKDDFGASALQKASTQGYLKVVRILLSNGEYVIGIINFGMTPLQKARTEEHWEVARMILENGENINVERNIQLHEVSTVGYLKLVRMLLENGADVNSKDDFGVTALQKASMEGHFDVVMILLVDGADIDEKDNFGVTALQEASTEGHMEVVRLLLENGADISIKDVFGVTALQKASTEGRLEVVRMLLDYGADVEETDNSGVSALRKAASDGRLEVVRMLLDYGGGFYGSYSSGSTALHKASAEGSLVLVRMLIEHGEDINEKDNFGVTALQEASTEGHLEVVRMLLENGADIDTKDDYGVPALHKASAGGHVEVVQMLLENWVTVNTKDVFGVTALQKAAMEGHLMVVWTLLDYGARINEKDTSGVTALHKAATEGHLEVVRMLLENWADINGTEIFGVTALHKAATEGHLKVVRMLLGNGAHINAKEFFGVTALHKAATEGHLEVVRLLINKGADVNVADKFGVTALHKASTKGHLEAVRILIRKGANINVTDSNGVTALMRASMNRHLKVVTLLLEKGADLKMRHMFAYTGSMLASAEGFWDIGRVLLQLGRMLTKKMSLALQGHRKVSMEDHCHLDCYRTRQIVNERD